MDYATLAITIFWVFLFIYAILGSIDFGSGFWAMAAGKREDNRASAIANLFLSPFWKVTNVFLVLLVVALVGFFPHAVYVLGTVLLLPAGLMLVLLIFRSTFMVYAYENQSYVKPLTVISGISGLLIPALLVSVLPVSLGGFVTLEAGTGYPQLEFARLLSSVTEYAHIFFAITTELFLSALFLAFYAREAGDESTYRFYRKAAVSLGPVTFVAAGLVMLTYSKTANWILSNLRGQSLWFGLSTVAFLIGYSALFWKSGKRDPGRPRIALLCIILQYGLAIFAYGAAHMPYMVYPTITVDEGVTNHSMFQQLLIGYTICTIILVPVFIWFWRLFVRDKEYLQQK